MAAHDGRTDEGRGAELGLAGGGGLAKPGNPTAEGEPIRLGESDPATSASAGTTQEDWYWGRTPAGAEEDYYWRRLSDNWYQKDVIPSTYLELHNACYEAYNANPLANYIIELTTNFVLGEGVTIEAKSKRVQKLIDAFWTDAHNQMPRRVFWLCSELSLYGELFVRFFVHPHSGQVQISQVDPSLIDQIETDPDNIEHPIRFHKRPVGPGSYVWSSTTPIQSGKGLEHPAGTSYDANTGSVSDLPSDTPATTPFTDVTQGEWLTAWPHFGGGDVFQFAINKVSNAKRGKSDLATLLPWLRRYRDWLLDRVRINKYKGAFLWDVTLAGADRKTIDRKRMEWSYPPEPGSIVFHNESEVWAAVQPRIDADNVEADGRAIKMMVAMGAGLPEHYLSEGGSVNYATAQEMGLPTFRKFQRRQDEFRMLLGIIIDRVLDEAVRVGALGKGADRGYRVILPELAPDDHQARAQGASTMADALAKARSSGWLSEETAQRLFMGAVDSDLNVEEERRRIEAERAAGVAAGVVPFVAGGPVAGEGAPAGAGATGGVAGSMGVSGTVKPRGGAARVTGDSGAGVAPLNRAGGSQ